MGLFGPPNVEKMKAKKDVIGLAITLANSKEDNLRLAAAEALTELGTLSVQPLINIVKCGRGDWLVLQTLIDVGGPSVVNPLISELKHSKKDTLKVAAQMLGELSKPPTKLGGKKAPGDVIPVRVPVVRSIESLISELAHSDTETRKATIDMLVAKGTPAIERLISLLEGDDKEMRDTAEIVLLAIGTPALGPLAVAFKEKGSLNIERTFSKIGGPAVEPVIAMIKDKKYRTPLYGSNAGLIAVLADENKWKVLAAYQLYEIGYYPLEPLTASIAATIKNNPSSFRLEIIKTLVEYGDAAIKLLITSLKQIPVYTSDLAKDVESIFRELDAEYYKILEDQVPSFKQVIKQIKFQEFETKIKKIETDLRNSDLGIRLAGTQEFISLVKDVGWNDSLVHLRETAVPLLNEMLIEKRFDHSRDTAPGIIQVIKLLGEIRDPRSIGALVTVIDSSYQNAITNEASKSLLKFSPKDIPQQELQILSKLDPGGRKFTTSEGGGYFAEPTITHWISIGYPDLVSMAEHEIERRRRRFSS